MVSLAKFFLSLLRPLGFLYSLLMKARVMLYQNNILRTNKIEAQVISVGNLTMGGSGKTPIVIYLARLLQMQGYKVAVVSRGYKGKAYKPTNLVSDGNTILLNSEEAGDEPRMMAELLPGVAVLTGRKRVFPCQYAAAYLHCDVIILDDGFQHVSVKRDVDLVLFNKHSLYHKYNVFPAGLLRESFSALKRCDSFVITNCPVDFNQSVADFIVFLQNKWNSKPLFKTRFVPSHLVNAKGDIFSFDHISEEIYGFCAIALPRRFQETLNCLPFSLSGFISFPDHYSYSQSCIKDIEDKAIAAGAKILLTTEKDLVKINHKSVSLPLFAVVMEISADPQFDEFILRQIKR